MFDSGGFKIRNKTGMHFLTFSVVCWVDVFTRQVYCDMVVESLKFCQENKGLLVHGWVIMSNHLHLLVSVPEGDLSAVLRDFKRFTASRILTYIEYNKRESRREWMMAIFRQKGQGNSRNKTCQFWQQDNHPFECIIPQLATQKLDYIHNNPVKAGMVRRPEDYRYSSADAYLYKRNTGLLKVDYV